MTHYIQITNTVTVGLGMYQNMQLLYTPNFQNLNMIIKSMVKSLALSGDCLLFRCTIILASCLISTSSATTFVIFGNLLHAAQNISKINNPFLLPPSIPTHSSQRYYQKETITSPALVTVPCTYIHTKADTFEKQYT